MSLLHQLEVVTPPAHLPIAATDVDVDLAAAVVEEVERGGLVAGHRPADKSAAS